jgi:hypothetical protein
VIKYVILGPRSCRQGDDEDIPQELVITVAGNMIQIRTAYLSSTHVKHQVPWS